MVQQRKTNMAKAAITVPCSNDTIFIAVRIIIAIMISEETIEIDKGNA